MKMTSIEMHNEIVNKWNIAMSGEPMTYDEFISESLSEPESFYKWFKAQTNDVIWDRG